MNFNVRLHTISLSGLCFILLGFVFPRIDAQGEKKPINQHTMGMIAALPKQPEMPTEEEEEEQPAEPEKRFMEGIPPSLFPGKTESRKPQKKTNHHQKTCKE